MRASLILKSVTATWMAVIVSAATSFLLTPLILHRLGDEAYGIWVLSVTLTDYYCFLQVGVRSAVVRYVSRNLALDDVGAIRRIVSTSFYFYITLAGVSLVLVFGFAPYVTRFFTVSAIYAGSFTGLFVLLGIAQAFDFPLSLSEGCLEAVGRFDQLYGIRIAGMLIRVTAILIVLKRGGGLLGVGAATVLSILLPRFLSYVLAFIEVKGFTFHLREFDWKIFRKMIGYGATSFAVGMGAHLRNALYPVVIAKFLSSSAVTLFSIPAKLLSVPLNGIGSMTEFVSPLSSQMEARQDKEGLRRLLIMSTEAACLLFAPMGVIMIVFGRQVITLWVGTAYGATYSLLVLLTFGMGVSTTQAATQSMLFGIGRHKPLVAMRFTEGIGTAALGILFLHFWGLWGYALASMIVPVVVNLFVVPRYACNLVELPYFTYLAKGWLKACLYSIPLAFSLLVFEHFWPIAHWKQLILGCLAGGIIYLLTLAVSSLLSRKFQVRWSKLETLAILERKYFGNPTPGEVNVNSAVGWFN
ncbi:MAG: oligosaccharide flippase family protein [Candidatus Acidiferrum sp.]